MTLGCFYSCILFSYNLLIKVLPEFLHFVYYLHLLIDVLCKLYNYNVFQTHINYVRHASLFDKLVVNMITYNYKVNVLYSFVVNDTL